MNQKQKQPKTSSILKLIHQTDEGSHMNK